MDATFLESSVKDLGVSISDVPGILPLTLSSSNKLVQRHGLLNISNYLFRSCDTTSRFCTSYHLSSLQGFFSLSCILCSKDMLYHCHNNHIKPLVVEAKLELEEMLKLAGFERKSWWGWVLIMNNFTLVLNWPTLMQNFTMPIS